MDIAVNSSVQFGYTASYTDNLVSLPKTFKLTTCETEVPKNNYETSFAITSTGGGQLTANITIKNISSKTITDWSLKFTYKNKIYNARRNTRGNKKTNCKKSDECRRYELFFRTWTC